LPLCCTPPQSPSPSPSSSQDAKVDLKLLIVAIIPILSLRNNKFVLVLVFKCF
jgi:hypothetical protein